MFVSVLATVPLAFFQFFDRTLASTETNNTSAESLGFQLFGARRTRAGMVRRVPLPLAAKDIEKKSKFDGAKSGRKKKFFQFNF